MKSFIGSLFEKSVYPVISPNTFFVWEPCTYSHAEVVPGYVKYLLDLGFNVSVLITPERYDEGLFCRFTDSRVALNRLSQASIRRYFKKHGLLQAKGILITTAGKLGDGDAYQAEHAYFENKAPDQKVLLVEHDIKKMADRGLLSPSVITLRKVYYKNQITTVINPHYFGQVKITAKNPGIVNFITIGALRGKRRNTQMLIDAVTSLHEQGITNFKITVVGRGSLRNLPAKIRSHFDIKGRLDFTRLYAEMEQADFVLTLLDAGNPQHERYITTGSSGNFQLIYGFQKPCLIAEKFAAVNGFSEENSIRYATNADLAQAMIDAINLAQADYQSMQQALEKYAKKIYNESLENLRALTT